MDTADVKADGVGETREQTLTEREIEKLATPDLLLLYKTTGNQAYKWPLAMRYTGLIKSIAIQICGMRSGVMQIDDIVNEGIITLLGSIDKFDMDKGIKFETYVSKRVRGMIIDMARKQDWIPRNVRRRSREIDQAVNELTGRFGRFPTDQELADYMGVGVEKFRSDLASTSYCNLVSLEALFERRGEGDVGLSLPGGDDADQPENMLMNQEEKRELSEGIKTLRKNEQLVLSLYYEKELNMRSIAQILEVSEPRVSQIHSRALQKLRVYLETGKTETGGSKK